MHLKGVVIVDLGQGTDPVRREELVLVQHVLEHAQQPLLGGDGQQVEELALVQGLHVRNLRRKEKTEKIFQDPQKNPE